LLLEVDDSIALLVSEDSSPLVAEDSSPLLEVEDSAALLVAEDSSVLTIEDCASLVVADETASEEDEVSGAGEPQEARPKTTVAKTSGKRCFFIIISYYANTRF